MGGGDPNACKDTENLSTLIGANDLRELHVSMLSMQRREMNAGNERENWQAREASARYKRGKQG